MAVLAPLIEDSLQRWKYRLNISRESISRLKNQLWRYLIRRQRGTTVQGKAVGSCEIKMETYWVSFWIGFFLKLETQKTPQRNSKWVDLADARLPSDESQQKFDGKQPKHRIWGSEAENSGFPLCWDRCRVCRNEVQSYSGLSIPSGLRLPEEHREREEGPGSRRSKARRHGNHVSHKQPA